MCLCGRRSCVEGAASVALPSSWPLQSEWNQLSPLRGLWLLLKGQWTRWHPCRPAGQLIDIGIPILCPHLCLSLLIMALTDVWENYRAVYSRLWSDASCTQSYVPYAQTHCNVKISFSWRSSVDVCWYFVYSVAQSLDTSIDVWEIYKAVFCRAVIQRLMHSQLCLWCFNQLIA